MFVYFSETKALVKNVESYIKKCTKSLSKQLFSVYIFTIKSQLNQLCKKDSKRRQEMLESSKCVNSAKQAFAQCVDRTIDHLQRIKLVDDNKKIPHLCWSVAMNNLIFQGNYLWVCSSEYHDNKACNAEGARKSGQCTEENLEAIDRFVDSVAGNSLNLLCGDFQEVTDKCKNIGKLPQNVKNPKKYKSFFIPAIEVISSLPQ